ncbi:hypothetical protein N0V93_001639 [Gnomoniopsis smithogilvyi]|uniref:Haloacid dehalogenase n=1 Tax=Gnomoniopsis smithogilvyi TaxID=1191159 RepID=A0A9W9D1E5_9PEZI|nr:hypothetical protein N0V93_001639 [Gnomoniopsis smithogilvyi]
MAYIDNTGPLRGYKALSFDCYGTLIEWEPNKRKALEPLIKLLPKGHDYATDPKLALVRYTELANEIEQSDPTRLYNLILVDSMKKLAMELGVNESHITEAEYEAMATGPGRWPPFADTIAALKVLKKHFKLIILSNVDNANIQRTVSGPLGDVEWDAVYTAEDIGSYKPSPKNFEYLFRRAKDELGADVEKGELLHVARSLKVDHSAAKALGFKSCWISRGGDTKEGQGIGGDYGQMMMEGEVSFQWKFDTLGDFATEVERQFGLAEA